MKSTNKACPSVYSKWSRVSVVDLKAYAGNMYRTGHDEAALCPGESKSDPVHVTIPGKYGELYPYDENRIAALVTSAKVARRMERELKEAISLHCGGGDETVYLFDQEHFNLVLKYIKPRRKRQLSPEQKRKAIERLKVYKFSRTSEQAREEIRREGEPIHA